MRVAANGSGRAGKDDVAAAKVMRVTHERADLLRAVALVEMDAPGIDHHRDLVDGADGHLKAVTRNGPGVNGKALQAILFANTLLEMGRGGLGRFPLLLIL